MQSNYKYYAFISYHRKDKKWAQWLQKQLEHYKLPVNISKQHPNIPKSLKPIFRDTTDLNGARLQESLLQALASSKYLIVICSPTSSKSRWVNSESRYFIENNREDFIIPFIVDGQPFSNDISSECFPECVRQLRGERELLGINVNDNGREAAVVRVISRMIGLNFDALWQRYNREQRIRRNIRMLLLSVITVLAIVISSFIYHQNILINSQNDRLLINQSMAVSDRANELVESGDAYTAAMLALRVLPTDIDNPDRPLTSEAEYALRNATSQNGGYLKGHTDRVYDAKMSHSGEFVVSGSYDNTIKIWDVNNGVCVKTLSGHKDRVYFIDISRDDRFILSVSDLEHVMKVWDLDTDECIKTIDFSALGNMCYAKFNDCGQKITTFIGRSVLVWDIDSASYSILYKDIVPKPVESYCYCHIGSKYITIRYSMTEVGIWNINEQRMESTKHFHFFDYELVSNDDKFIVITRDLNENSCIKVYNIENGLEIQNIPAGGMSRSLGAISPDGKYLATASNCDFYGSHNNSSIDIWDIERGECIKSFSGHVAEKISLSPCGKYVISAGSDEVVGLWCIENRLSEIIIPSGSKIEWTDGNLVCYTIDKKLNVYNIVNDEIIFSCDLNIDRYSPQDHFQIFDISNNQYIFTRVEQSFPKISDIYHYPIVVYDIINNVTRSFEFNHTGDKCVSFSLDDVILTKDHKYLIASFIPSLHRETQQEITFSLLRYITVVWDFSTGERLHTLSEPEYSRMDIKICGQSRFLYLVSQNGSAKLWNVDTKTPITLTDSSRNIGLMIQIPSKNEIVFSYANDMKSYGICLYNTTTGRYDTLLESRNKYNCMAISNDNKEYVVTGGGQVLILSTTDHSVIKSFPVEKGVISVKLNKDDKYMAILDGNGDVNIYDFKKHALISILR